MYFCLWWGPPDARPVPYMEPTPRLSRVVAAVAAIAVYKLLGASRMPIWYCLLIPFNMLFHVYNSFQEPESTITDRYTQLKVGTSAEKKHLTRGSSSIVVYVLAETTKAPYQPRACLSIAIVKSLLLG